MDYLTALIKNPAFWAAVSALINAVVAYAVPNAPPAIVAAVNALLAVVFAAISAPQVIANAKAAQSARRLQASRDAQKMT